MSITPYTAAELAAYLKPFNIKTLAIAVSGGADSLALTLLSNEWAQKENKKIVALTFDHKLRPESTSEAKTLGKWLAKYKIPHHIIPWQDQPKIKNLQNDARQARYHHLTTYCTQHKIPHLLVAHTLEDQAETILMNLMRGSGIDGLCGIRQQTTINNIKILRPLLDIPKAKLTTYLESLNQPWIEDPSNQNEDFLRINTRNFLNNSKDKDLLIKRLADTATNLKRSQSFINTHLKQALNSIVTDNSNQSYTINHQEFLNLHEEIALRLLATLLNKTSKNYYKPRLKKLQTLHHHLKSPNPKPTTLHNCTITTQDNKITIRGQ